MTGDIQIAPSRMNPETPSDSGASCVPEAWCGSVAEKGFQQKLEASTKRTLLFDYDGTLAPFHVNKMQALPYPGIAEILQELRARSDTRLVLVTGRRVADLEQLLDLAKYIELWGSHGREHVEVNRAYTFYPPTAEQRATLDRLQTTIEASLRDVPLSLETGDPSTTPPDPQPQTETSEPLEVKPTSLAVHWRGLTTESQALLRESADAAYNLHGNPSIARLPFASGVEFRAEGHTKAFAVEKVLQDTGVGDLVAYFGDDLTDEDAFAALGERGLSFLVRPTVRASRANYWLRPPDELLAFLKLLI